MNGNTELDETTRVTGDRNLHVVN